MLTSIIPLIILLIIIAMILLVVKISIDKSKRGPSEREGMKNGLLVALLTDSWILGWIYTKRKSDYDYDERKLK